MDLSRFDIISWLDDKGIPHEPKGDWETLQCPFCSDSEMHLGVNHVSKAVSCFRCGKHHLRKLIREMEGCNNDKADEILIEYEEPLREVAPKRIVERVKTLTLPKEFSPHLPKEAQDYLLSRGFPKEVFSQWELYYPGHLGRYKFRIIFPIYHQGKMVSWVARAINNTLKPSYLFPGVSVVPPKNCLFGYDLTIMGNVMIVVEGVMDQLKLGRGAVATFGTQWTDAQVALIKSRKPSKVYILFDSEPKAQESACKLSRKLWFCDSEILELEGVKDPGCLSLKEGKELMRELCS
jgi:DNA primase